MELLAVGSRRRSMKMDQYILSLEELAESVKDTVYSGRHDWNNVL